METVRRAALRHRPHTNSAIPPSRPIFNPPFSLGDISMQQQKNDQAQQKTRFNITKLEDRIAPSSANFPPGQFPSGNPAHAPGNSNPNEVPSNNPSND